MAVYNATPHHTTPHHTTKVLCILSWYTSYKVHGTRFGGSGFFIDYLRSLQKYYDVAAYVPFESETDSEFNDEEEWGVRTFRYKFPQWYLRFQGSTLYKILRRAKIIKFYELLHFINGFRKVYKAFKPDIVHALAAENAGIFSSLLLKFYRIPLVVTEHQFMVGVQWYRRTLCNIAYKAAKKNVCVSNGQRELFKKEFPEIDFSVIYNGIPDLPVDLSQKKYRRDGLINCAIVAAFYARDTKGLQFLLPAIKILVTQHNLPIVLHVLGGGKFLEYHKKLADELGINDSCIFYDRCTRSEVYSIVSEMDFGVSASLFESAGVNVEEMMLRGKPMVVTKSGGANSLVTDFSAIVVDKGSTEALVDGILEMSKRYREFDSNAIREYALKNFTLDASANKYKAIFDELAAK